MQYVNDDMDNLFRKAGKEYPLNVKGADWDKIASALDGLNPVEEKTAPGKGRRRFLWLLLLLPLPWLCHRYSMNNEGITSADTNLKKDTKLHTNGFSSGNKQVPNLMENTTTATVKDLPKNDEAFHESKAGNKKSASKNHNLIVDPSKIRKSFSAQSLTDIDLGSSSFDLAASSQTSISKITPLETRFPQPIDPLVPVTSLEKSDVSFKLSSQPTIKKNNKRFYLGVLSGIGVTTVKFQKVNDYGYDLGVVAGYDVNQKWSIEAGVFSTQKKYYTDGKEFNTSKMYIPANTRLTSVDGSCRMIEIPVVARYRFPSGSQHNWFVAGGVSNFLMKQEDYDYVYLYMSSGNSAKYSRTYKKTSQHWMASAQLSGGYVYRLKEILEIRAEPYLQIPLKGTGFGSLPLTSAGLRIGVTKKLF